MFALNQLPNTSKAQNHNLVNRIQRARPFGGEIPQNITQPGHRCPKSAAGGIRSDLVPKELNFLIASKHVDSDSESDEDEDLSIAPTAWILGITQGTATLSPTKKSRGLRAATKIMTAEMAQAALYMLVAIITAYHGDEWWCQTRCYSSHRNSWPARIKISGP